MRALNLTGKRFGRLVVQSFHSKDNNGRNWQCLCDCGNVHIVRVEYLRSGDVRSCGCLLKNKEKRKHGYARKIKKDATYLSWLGMKNRCYNKSNKDWIEWGGRGITVCERWIDSFENFLSDMGDKPNGNYSIDRINNNGNYEPKNCRWATPFEQARNRRKRRKRMDGTVVREK